MSDLALSANVGPQFVFLEVVFLLLQGVWRNIGIPGEFFVKSLIMDS